MQINITRPNFSVSQTIRLGKNGALLELPNTTNLIGNTTMIKVNGQVGRFYTSILNSTFFYIPPYVQQRPTLTPVTPRNIIDLLTSSHY